MNFFLLAGAISFCQLNRKSLSGLVVSIAAGDADAPPVVLASSFVPHAASTLPTAPTDRPMREPALEELAPADAAAGDFVDESL